ncbi:MAG TPA: citryl-CoA lyase [Candidatus Binatia bacterium]|nr:citryl-CoA lyase [Candidatus Binatia bacterium]
MAQRKKQQTPEDWWSTAIIEMRPGVIRYRGYAIEELIGRVGFAEMVWLLTRGELPDPNVAKLLEAALVAAVDHGPQAPSIAVARMAMTCGLGINNAMASAINLLGDVHGGAGEQCVALFNAIGSRVDSAGVKPGDLDAIRSAAEAEIQALADNGISHVPGYGHRFHPTDPRAPRLLELVDQAAAASVISGRFAAIGRMVETILAGQKGRKIPMNIDGATGVIFAELGFPPLLCRGLFVLSRSVGVLAHAWEESQSGNRNKGPIPRHFTWTYTGPAARSLGSKK